MPLSPTWRQDADLCCHCTRRGTRPEFSSFGEVPFPITNFWQVLLCVIEIQQNLATTLTVFDCFFDLGRFVCCGDWQS
jgi:hypothetical protein